jgi:very-short-patch-repair endonuclease
VSGRPGTTVTGDDARFHPGDPVAAAGAAGDTPVGDPVSCGPVSRGATTDAVIAGLAAEQHGVVARWQLLELGIGAGEIARRRRDFRLHPVRPGWRGVYLVGHTAAPVLALETAALLLTRRRASALGRWSAAAFHGFADPRAGVDVLQVGGNAPVVEGVRTSVVTELPEWQVVRHRGVWVTTPARTFLDLSAVAPIADVERCLDRARIARVITDVQLEAVLAWAGRRRGARPLRDLLWTERDGGYSRSRAERRLRALLTEAGLPAPVRNGTILGRERDLAWPDARTVVEFDGRRYHVTPQRWEHDRDRDGELLARGWQTFRVTWTMLCHRPHEVVARAAAILALAGRDGAGASGDPIHVSRAGSGP